MGKRKHWDAKLTARAKDELFNTFHTKSDDFLDDVAEDRIMGTFPTLRKTGSLKRWLKIQLAPASTAHYLDADFSPAETDALKIHSPALIVFLLVMVKAFEPLFGKPKRQPAAKNRQ